ncbi:cytochrome P450 [Parasphingorhabdus sp.]|uniref:cytochrome P450 n=1 Tax=Parasphingorhabdus sp. TaxID=2709688 RepID=UPI003C794B1A
MASSAQETGVPDVADPWTLPLDKIDMSNGNIFAANKHGEYFKRLRTEDPVHYCAESPFGPYWSITKYKDIVAVDTNHKIFSSNRDIALGDNPPDLATGSFIQMDQPKHDVHRNAAQPAVAPKQLANLEALIRTRVCAILDSLPIGEPFNWVELVSKELTTQMLATLFDFPFEDRHLLPMWSDAVTTTAQAGITGIDEEKRKELLGECMTYFVKLWHKRAGEPPQLDFISLLAHNPDTKDLINDPMEFLGTIVLLIVAGNDTTRNSISGGVVALNQFPEEYDKLRTDHSLIPNMVSEIIRFQSPLGHMRRNALEDIQLGGKLIRKGDKVVMWYVSGNRDDEVIENPDQFIIDRSRARQHVSFGFGIHRCMGNRLAEMQIRILWEEIMKRFNNIEMVGEPKRVASNFVMGFENVPVVIHAGSGAAQ